VLGKWERTWYIPPGTELSTAFIVLCHNLKAFLMEFSEGEHCQPMVYYAQHRGMRSICFMEAGQKTEEGYH